MPLHVPPPSTFDDLSDGTTNKAFTSTEKSKLSNIEADADVTDPTNVNAAGATMNTDTDVSGNSWVLDEDDLDSDSATKVATQQSIKAYVDGAISAAFLSNYPVGCTIIGADSGANPASYLPGMSSTTWARVEGKMIIGASDSDDDFDLNETGGAKTHTLTINEMPSHSHARDRVYGGSPSFGGGSDPILIPKLSGATTQTLNSDPTGGGDPHPIMNPYLAKYVWQRTA